MNEEEKRANEEADLAKKARLDANARMAEEETERLVAMFGTEDVCFGVKMEMEDGQMGVLCDGNRLTMIEMGLLAVKAAADDADMPMAKLLRQILEQEFRVYL